MYFKLFITNGWVHYYVSYWCLWWKAWKLNSWIEFHVKPQKLTSEVLAYWFKGSFRMSILFTFLLLSNYWITTRIACILLKDLSLPRYEFHSDYFCSICKARITSEARFLSQRLILWPARKRSGCHKPLGGEVLWSSTQGDNKEVLSWEWSLLRERGALEDITPSVLPPSFPTLNNYT